MKQKVTVLSIAIVAFFATAFAADQIALRPGQYEVIAEMHLPGAPAPRTFRDLDCITAEDVIDLAKLMTREVESEADCEVLNLRMTGNKLTFDTACSDGDYSTEARTEVTFRPDGYSLVMTMNTGGDVTTSKAIATWIGETCAVSDRSE